MSADRLARYVAADDAQNAELEARVAAWRHARTDLANMDEWDKRAREAVEWGIVYENPEAIVLLAEEVRRLRGTRAELLRLAEWCEDHSTSPTTAELRSIAGQS